MSNPKPTDGGVPTEAELIERARNLAPVLRERADACEDIRSVPLETIEDFDRAGFYRILQPAAVGGYEMSPITHYRVVMEVAKACPSSGWCLSIVGIHNWEMALLDPQAAEAVWETDTATRVSSSYAPFGKVERVEGGFRVSGRWPWSSGSDHCTWAFLGGFAPVETEGGFDLRAFLIPRADYEIEDNWHVLGLKGTGSKIVHVRDAFVPEHRTHKMADNFLMQNPGLQTFTSHTYRYPFTITFVATLTAAVLGMAEGALETFGEQMSGRHGVYDGSKAMDDPFVRQRSAHASFLIRAARTLFEADFAQLEAAARAGELLPPETRVAMRWDMVMIAKTAQEAIDLLFKATGARGLMLGNPMQRYFRDANAASNHNALNADQGSLNAGLVAMGGQNTDFFI